MKKDMSVRKLEEDYFDGWKAGTELDREGFKEIMLIELQRSTLLLPFLNTNFLSLITPLVGPPVLPFYRLKQAEISWPMLRLSVSSIMKGDCLCCDEPG
jgi:hypothetical protein